MATPTPVFPAAVATDADLKVANNLVKSGLTVALGAADGIIWVGSVVGFVPNCLVSIDNEIIAIATTQTTPQSALLVAPGGRGFDGTSAASHSAGAGVSMLIDAWHHNVLSTEVKAIESFLGPNGQNINGQLSGIFLANAFAFTLSPGGNLTVGANQVTISPVPPGVYGTDTNHFLWISGGTGTPEVVQITGGTATPGPVPGTLFFNCTYAHSGAWTMQPASGGIYEAANQFVHENRNAMLLIDQPITVYWTIFMPNSPVPQSLTIMGCGSAGQDIVRAQSMQNQDLFYITSSQPWPSITLSNMNILDAPADGSWGNNAGSCIHFQNYGYVPAVVDNVLIANCCRGVWIDGSQMITVTGGQIAWMAANLDNLNTAPFAGVEVSRTTQTMPSNIVLQGLRVGGIYSATRRNAQAGILISSSDGMMISDCLIGQMQWGFNISGDTFYVNITNSIIDYTEAPLLIDGSTGSLLGPIIMSNNWFGAVAASASPGPVPAMVAAVEISATSTEANATAKFSLVGNTISGGGLYGIKLAGANFVGSVISGNDIVGNNSLNNTYGAGIILGQGASHFAITGNCIRDIGPIIGYQNYGVEIADPGSIDLNISGNTLVGNLVAPMLLTNLPTQSVIANNTGVDDVAPSIASGISITLPPNPNFILTGTAAVSNVAGMWEGRTGTFRTPNGAVTFGASATIGNGITTVANVPVTYWVQGGQLWLK